MGCPVARLVSTVPRDKARLAAIVRHHGPDSLASQLARAQLDRAVRMAVVLDVAEAYPEEFRYVARQLLDGEVTA